MEELDQQVARIGSLEADVAAARQAEKQAREQQAILQSQLTQKEADYDLAIKQARAENVNRTATVTADEQAEDSRAATLAAQLAERDGEVNELTARLGAERVQHADELAAHQQAATAIIAERDQLQQQLVAAQQAVAESTSVGGDEQAGVVAHLGIATGENAQLIKLVTEARHVVASARDEHLAPGGSYCACRGPLNSLSRAVAFVLHRYLCSHRARRAVFLCDLVFVLIHCKVWLLCAALH